MIPTVRPLRPDDLSALRGLHDEHGRPPVVDRVLTEPADTPGEDLLWRLALVEGDDLRGYAYLSRARWHPEGQVQGEVFVRPAVRGRGHGSALLDAAVGEARRIGATSFVAFANGAFPEQVGFAEKRGFEVAQRFVTMTLDPALADPAELDRLVDDARRRGLTVFSFAETAMDEDARRRLYELNRRLAPLLPGNGDAFPGYEGYASEVLDAPWFRPEGQLVAAQGDRWIALVGLGFHGEDRLQHEFTAVDPEHRGRGAALALKALAVRLARRWGVREIRTGNDATNAPIIALNRRLGYEARPGMVKLRRRL